MPYSSIRRPHLRLLALTAVAVVMSPAIADVTRTVPAFALLALAMVLTAMLLEAGPHRHLHRGAARSTRRRAVAPAPAGRLD